LTAINLCATVEASTTINEGDVMPDFAIAALAHEHIHDLQREAARAQLAREAAAGRRSARPRRPSVDVGMRLSRLWTALAVRRPSAQPCCVA
jgi:hypothetical protein